MIIRIDHELDQEMMASKEVRENIFIDLDAIESPKLCIAIYTFFWPDCKHCRKSAARMPAKYLQIKKGMKTDKRVFLLHNEGCLSLEPPKVDVEEYLLKFIKTTIT